ncbi:Uncharacterised protein [Candidatus Venteria ishoeyi]|uniref:Uncharacterized protein n=1 Tax=Candidatus Venteria ishoeyi TaxID=1899563 RepID=A0A1H6F856_9GAMM|nr:Uncharacterised protein [Candidatus Venteria ishoeyi]
MAIGCLSALSDTAATKGTLLAELRPGVCQHLDFRQTIPLPLQKGQNFISRFLKKAHFQLTLKLNTGFFQKIFC